MDATEKAGLGDKPTRTWGAAWGDVTGNGRPDLFVGRHWGVPRLFVNRNGSFKRFHDEDAFRPAETDRHACAWGEADGDGRPDLYCTQGGGAGRGEAPNQLFLQRDGGFINRARKLGVRNRFGRGRTVQWLDYDQDGRLDLFVGNRDRGPGSRPNELLRNTGRGFQRAEAEIREKLRTIGTSWADWTGNGYPDVVVLQDDKDTDGAVAYENQQGRYKRVTIPPIAGHHWLSADWGDFDGDGKADVHLVGKDRALLLQNRGTSFKKIHEMKLNEGRMSVWLDVDNDGDLDLYVVQGAPGEEREDPDPSAVNGPNFLLVQDGGRFKEVRDPSLRGPRRGNSGSVTAADYNRNGTIDVLLTNGYLRFQERVTLLENRSRAGNWIGVDLQGDKRNPWGIGAKIRVASPAVSYWRHVTDGFNSRSQREVGYVHLGIADSDEARVRVEWSDGTRDCTRAKKNTIAVISKGEMSC